tara:strand:+ start:503 stop:670 length:168 start_codon:yes stop_codon:yes gene_type:complete
MNNIKQLTQIRIIRGMLSNDEQLSATFELMIVLCNLLLNSDNYDILKMINDELTS